MPTNTTVGCFVYKNRSQDRNIWIVKAFSTISLIDWGAQGRVLRILECRGIGRPAQIDWNLIHAGTQGTVVSGNISWHGLH